jgi:hypothetical protein
MRRLDLKPLKKLRNPDRRLRELARWPETIAEGLPDATALAEGRFWNFKVPVDSKLVEPPHATPETQRACLAAIFAAAEAVERSARRPSGCRVACLVVTPWMFSSEVTLFADEDYFRTFLPPQPGLPSGASRATWEGGWVDAASADAGALAPMLPPAPEGLAFMGGTMLTEFRSGTGETFGRINWVWAYPRR